MGTIAEIETVCFVGAGTMGCVNALVAAVAGYDTVLYDLDAATLDQVPARQRQFADYMVATGFCTEQDATAAFGRVRTTTDPRDAAERADLLSESVVERLDVKRRVHQQFDELCPANTILTTNASSLLVSEIEDAVQRGDRFAALHSHLGSPLVDIVGGPRTTAETVELLRRYVLSLGAVPLVLKRENPGYVVNALLGPFLVEGVNLVVRGASDVEGVDRAWMAHRDALMGPFALLDLFGLDMVLDNWEHPNRDDTPFRTARRDEAIAPVKRLVDQGHFGMKTATGFYDYPDPAYQRAGFLDGADPTIHSHLVTAIAMRAALLADDGVAEPHDIDRAWMTATSLQIGPFGLIDEIGTEQFIERTRQRVAAGLVEDGDARRAEAFVASRGDGFYTYPDPEYARPEFLRPVDDRSEHSDSD